MLADFAVTLHPNLGTYFKNNKDMSKIALGTWAWAQERLEETQYSVARPT